LRDVVGDKINPNILTAGRSEYTAVVLRYNDVSQAEAICGSVEGARKLDNVAVGQKIISEKDPVPQDTVNARIEELSPAIPLPPAIDYSTGPATQPPAPCDNTQDAATLITNMTAVFKVPLGFPDEIKAGYLINVRVYDQERPQRGGTVLEVLKDKDGYPRLAPLEPRKQQQLAAGQPCPPDAPPSASAENPFPDITIPRPPNPTTHGDLQIIKMHDVFPSTNYKERRSVPLPKAIVVNHSVTRSPQRTRSVLVQRKLSTHYEVARDGKVFEYLDPTVIIAYHAGRSNNDVSIGVIMTHDPGAHKEWPDAQVRSAKKLIAYLVGKYNISPRVPKPRCGRGPGMVWPPGPTCEKLRKPNGARKFINEGYGIIRQNNIHTTLSPGTFPIHDMEPSGADVGGVGGSRTAQNDIRTDQATGG